MQHHYRPPFWLVGRHLQTILPALLWPLPEVQYCRTTWDTPDGDFIELDWLEGNQQQPLVILFHGLEGSSNSHYALRIMAGLQKIGWRGVVVHFRGCGGKPNLKPRSYHSGDSAEIDWILKRLRAEHQGKIYAVGVSLGGNALLKWLGEEQDSAADTIDKAVAVSAPLALPTTGHVLGSGFNLIYTWLFLKTLRPKALAMIAKYQLAIQPEAITSAKTLWKYDDVFTAPLHGFQGVEDYWEKSNSRPLLKHIRLPTLLINARNDPFLPEKDLPLAEELPANVMLDFPEHGGHVGFASHFGHSEQDWLPSRILRFLADNE